MCELLLLLEAATLVDKHSFPFRCSVLGVGAVVGFRSFRIKFSTDKQTHRPFRTTGASNWAHWASGGMHTWGHLSPELDHYLYSPCTRARIRAQRVCSLVHLRSCITFAAWLNWDLIWFTASHMIQYKCAHVWWPHLPLVWLKFPRCSHNIYMTNRLPSGHIK